MNLEPKVRIRSNKASKAGDNFVLYSNKNRKSESFTDWRYDMIIALKRIYGLGAESAEAEGPVRRLLEPIVGKYRIAVDSQYSNYRYSFWKEKRTLSSIRDQILDIG